MSVSHTGNYVQEASMLLFGDPLFYEERTLPAGWADHYLLLRPGEKRLVMFNQMVREIAVARFAAYVAAIQALAEECGATDPGEPYCDAEAWRDAFTNGLTPARRGQSKRPTPSGDLDNGYTL